jgi:SAM-dependent methyltransferase
MHLDAIEIRNFYLSPRGRIVRQILGARIRDVWPDLRGERVLGLGHATPFLRPFREEAERVMGFMPAQHGVFAWPPEGPSTTALVLDDCLPLPDASVTRVLLVHALEGTTAPNPLLREVWRVLAPGGRVLVVVANRTGLWARVETTPFGVGRPFTRGQITRLVEDLSFAPSRVEHALFVPPSTTRSVLGSARGWDRMGSRFWPKLAGVVLVEAEKRMTQPIVAGRKRRVPVFAPALAPTPAAGVRACLSGAEETPPVRRTGSRTTTAR